MQTFEENTEKPVKKGIHTQSEIPKLSDELKPERKSAKNPFSSTTTPPRVRTENPLFRTVSHTITPNTMTEEMESLQTANVEIRRQIDDLVKENRNLRADNQQLTADKETLRAEIAHLKA